MTNDTIADYFTLYAKLLDIHGDAPLKAKAATNAAFTIERATTTLAALSPNELANIPGIGISTAKKIQEILAQQSFAELTTLIAATPKGILELLQIKGIGPKKIQTLWKELNLTTPEQVLAAAEANILQATKGFGQKTQQTILQSIQFYLGNKNFLLYAQWEPFVHNLTQITAKLFPNDQFLVAGSFARQLPVIEQLNFVTTVTADALSNVLQQYNCEQKETAENHQIWETDGHAFTVHFCSPQNLAQVYIGQTGSDDFVQSLPAVPTSTTLPQALEQLQIQHLPPYLWEQPVANIAAPPANMVQPSSIKGIIHSHSTWSDGANTLEEMAKEAQKQGFEYLVISDHSKSAFYANGLSVERILQQHKQIEALNAELYPFTIYKSIEADILNDGSLDYDDEVLALFDLVIASIHSQLQMPAEKAMQRLLAAVENPYTTILGHCTGRLLLSREGYPVNHTELVDACAANNVVIELNAHPKRLDIDWQYLPYMKQRGVLTSINPDAHATDGFADIKYGCLVAQKAGITTYDNLSSFSKAAFEEFLQEQHSKRT